MLVLLLAFVCLCNAYSSLQEPSGPPPPPQSNPNHNTESHAGMYRNPLDPLPDFNRQTTSKTRAATSCDINAIAAASGERLTSLVRDAPPNCINGIFSIATSQARDACNEADMVTVANAFYSLAYNYDGSKTSSTPGILNYILFLRACYYVHSSNKNVVGPYSANLLPVVRYGLDVFLKRPLEATNDDHYQITSEAISLISNAGDYLNYMAPLAALLTKLSNAWKFQSSVFIQKATQGDVINSIYDNYFRAHYDEKAATTYFCSHNEVPQSLNDFMDRHGDFLNTNNEWLLRNTGGELARFVKYSCLSSQVSYWLKNQMAKYTTSNAPKIYYAIADKIVYYDNKNCAAYNLCTFKADLEKKILPFTKTCDKTYTDVFKIRAEQISDAEANEVCRRLKEQESYFHNLVKDNWKPVNPDVNSLIEVVIFDNADEYKFYAAILFGISTDNGGMYIEGDPSKPGNIARYFCYERPKNGQFDVWNLEHEFTHYLDGRYDMYGDFTAGSSSGHTIWWLEGFAEYAANKQQYPSMVQDCKDKSYSLWTIFNNNYSSGTDRVYHYGYLAARFMFERHRSDVDTIMGYFRVGQYSQYESFINGIGSRYDQEFSNWCTCIANGSPC